MATDSWNPFQYEKFKAQRSEPFFDLMTMLKPVANATIVDLGCGTGELTAELHRRMQAHETLGLDSSDAMLIKAKAFEGDGLSFANQDISKWSAVHGVDILFSNAALQWCSDHPSLFQHLTRSLNPGGQLAIQMPMNHDYATHVLAREMANEPAWAALLHEGAREPSLLTVEEYAMLLFKLGFKEQNVVLKVYGHELPSREGVVEWVQGTLLTYYQSRLSAADYARFVTEFRDRLFQRLPEDRPFFYPFKRVLLWARL